MKRDLYKLLTLGAVFLVLLSQASCVRSHKNPTQTRSLRLLSRGGDRVIVFVHGVFGDLEGTWRNDRSGAFWPEMLLDDPDMRGFDAVLVGFNSPLFGSSQTLEELSTGVFQRLSDEGVFSKYREIYFIAHSMGGLITQRILITLNSPAYVEMLRKVKAVVLLSTPSGGAPIAELASYVSANPQLQDMAPATLNSWIQAVQNDIVRLRNARDSVAERYPRMFAGYETLRTHGVTIVSRVYASTQIDQPMMPFDRDHPGIAKPGDRDDDVYKWAKARIRIESIADSALAAPIAVDMSQGQEQWTDFRTRLSSLFPGIFFITKPFTVDTLRRRRTQVLILPLPYHQQLSENKVRELQRWVEQGGGLLLLGYYAEVHHGSNPTKLASVWGVSFGPHVLLPDSLTDCEASRGHSIGADPRYAISATVPVDSLHSANAGRRLSLVSSTTLSLAAGRATPLWAVRSQVSTVCNAIPYGTPTDGVAYPVRWAFDGQRSEPVAMALKPGLGRIVIIGTWKVATLPNADNDGFLREVVGWLGSKQ